MVSPAALLADARQKRPGLDHVIRAYGRFSADAGNRQAASITYFGFLSFFPLLALAASLLGFFLGDDAVGEVVKQVNSYAPGLAKQLGLAEILGDNRKAGVAGLIGLGGLLYAGLGWVDALRQGLRSLWHHNVNDGNFFVTKAKDVVLLAGLGGTLLASIAVSGVATVLTTSVLDLLGLGESGAAVVLTKVLTYALGLLSSTLLFLFLFWRLPKVQTPLSLVVRGALLGGVLFEVLKSIGAVYIARTTSNPLYGSFAVIVGLLIWINLVSRVLLLCAAWTVTAPYDSDVAPSGTASVALAKEAGIPVEFADNDPDDPPVLQDDGAPTPLAPAVEGVAAARVGAAVPLAGAPPARTTATAVLDGPPPSRAEVLARQAGQFTAGAAGMVVMAVALSTARTVRNLFRR